MEVTYKKHIDAELKYDRGGYLISKKGKLI